MPFAQTPNGRIYFADHRRVDSRYMPVLLIHGAGGSHLDWSAELRRLPEANAIAPDLPGHGKSPAPGRRSVEAYAADIVGLMDALDLPKAIIAGQSMGGAIAQMMALDYAARVAGLILIGTGAKLSVHPDILNRVLEYQDEVAALLKDWYWAENTEDHLREGTYQQLMATPAEIIHGDYAACNQFDVRERLSQIAAPTLVIGGTQDRMTPHKYSVYLQEHIPDAQLFSVEGGGHMMVLEYPRVVASAVREWLIGLKSGIS